MRRHCWGCCGTKEEKIKFSQFGSATWLAQSVSINSSVIDSPLQPAASTARQLMFQLRSISFWLRRTPTANDLLFHAPGNVISAGTRSHYEMEGNDWSEQRFSFRSNPKQWNFIRPSLSINVMWTSFGFSEAMIFIYNLKRRAQEKVNKKREQFVYKPHYLEV